MSTTSNQNIILSKIDKIRSAFIKETEKGKQLIVCKMKYEDVEMIDAFCLTEDSNLSKLDDIIITFKSPFNNYSQFSNELVKELLASFQTTKELAGDNNWVLKEWHPEELIKKEKDKSSPLFFFRILQSMIDVTPDFENNVYAFLSPKRNENKKQFAKWIEDSLNANIPARCGILISEGDSDTYVSSVAAGHPKGAVIYPDLKMNEAIKKMATAGNPSKPDVQFRKCLFNMKEGIPKKDSEHIIFWRNEAKKIALQQQWKDMLVTTDLAAGTFMLHISEKKKAIEFYDQAINSGKELVNINPRLGNALTIQAMASKGAAMVSSKNYPEAIKLYEDLGGFATNAEDYMNAMEAWRMAGYCYKTISQKKKALVCNNNALNAAEHMNPELRPHTTLPYVGKEIMELTPRDEAGLQILKEIDHKMKSFVGDDWQTRYQQ